VIDQAVRDVRNPDGAPIDGVSARAFLSGSPMLSYWCEIAGLDPSWVIDRARILMAGCETGARSPDNPIRARVLPPDRFTSDH
jgi:hypothetical protein